VKINERRRCRIVDSKSAFRGFSDDIVIIVGTPLIVVFWPLR